jgi:SAM-dependent methyltransferase
MKGLDSPVMHTRYSFRLDHLYATRFSPQLRARKTRLWKTLCEAFLCQYVPSTATVLDVGAGYCDFINQIPAAHRIAIDLNPDTRRFAAKEVEVHLLPLERLGEVIAPSSIDVAFASNVFEHLRGPDVLLEILESLFHGLRPGGRLIVMQPNVRLVGTRFWDFVDHTLPLTEKGMAEALAMSGFEIIERRTRFLPYSTKSWLPQWPLLVRMYLWLRPAQWVFGKQMFHVARRPLGSQNADSV